MTVSTFLIVALPLLPAWFPAIRLFQFFLQRKLQPRTVVWLYALSFLWTAGGVLFLFVIGVPSGIPYGLILLIAWPLLIAAMIADGPSSKKTGAKQ